MNAQEKILSFNALKKRLLSDRRRGKKIVFTNGCFDLLHIGHVAYLEKAKKKNSVLVIGLNSDRSVRRIKGQHRPIVPEKERAYILAALSVVDYVVIFNEDTPQRTIEVLKPDVLVKGADWKGKTVAGGESVKSYGGKVEFIKFLPNRSSTNIIQTVLQKCK